MRKLMDSELDLVSGGEDNYTHCPNGTAAGGGPGYYANGANCNGPGGAGGGLTFSLGSSDYDRLRAAYKGAGK